jgi:methionyl-tRNA synthetase
VTCERFFTDKDLVDGKCPSPGCGREVERITESNYFFRMSKYQDWLIDYINTHPGFIQPDFRRNETLGFLRKKLNDLCISRPKSRLNWGIDLPFDDQFVTYVWFDALVNYISAVGYAADDEEFNRWWPVSYHLIGKDILTTHTVYWPTMLKAMDLPMPEAIFAHGWWLVGRDKMSKSLGNVVNPMEMADKYGVDAFRYFLMAEMTLGQDASFTEEAFVRRYNADLANDLGNMFSRVLKMIATQCGGVIPASGPRGEDEERLKAVALAAAGRMVDCVESMRIDQGLAELAGVTRAANRYFEKREPWKLAKTGDLQTLGTVLYTAAETMRIVGGMLYPVMPAKMTELRVVLGLGDGAPDFSELLQWGKLEPGLKTGALTSLFPRIVPKETVVESPSSAATPGAAAKAVPAAKPEMEGVAFVEYADFAKLDLRTARILEAERIEGADKLLRLQVDCGGQKRQLVAGIAKHYAAEELPGKTIVIVANLKPATIRGVQSNGMLLAAHSGGALRLVTVDGQADTGAKVS